MMDTKILANAQVWRAELTIGTMAGYEGEEVVTHAALVEHLEVYQQRPEPWYPVIVWSSGKVIGPAFPTETVFKITLESNPLYSAQATDADIHDYAMHLADYLAVEFLQTRVYVALYPIRSFIVGTS